MIKNRLKEIRMKEYMLSQKEFIEMLGINKTTYSQWESGVSSPPLNKALEIAKILKRNIEDIWYLEE